nr:hypothetical protein [Tanacetum cinerariifolium]
MTTLAEHIIIAGAENRPLILEKTMYDSWASRIRLFIKGNKNGRMMLDLIDKGPLVYPMIDVQAINIILYDLPPDVYSLVNHQEAAKDIWDRVKLLMKGTELSYQEHECKLYNLFDKFDSVQGETLYEYYWRFSLLINDMHSIGMTMQQVQVNTKFLNALPPEWSKFVTDTSVLLSLHFSKERIRLTALTKQRHSCLLWHQDLDTYDSDYDDISLAKMVLMANLSRCDSDVHSEDNSGENQNVLTFNQLFEINELKAQSQEKDIVIRKLKDRIKSLSEKDSVENGKKDIDEIETINIELEHNLNAQLQEKVFAIAALKNKLRKLKGKTVVNTAVSTPIATIIAPGMFKIYLEPLAPKLLKNKDAHIDYIKHSRDHVDPI